MIVCANCASAQCLQITRSKVTFEDSSSLSELHEEYHCTLCDSTGTYVFDGESEHIDGEISQHISKPWPGQFTGGWASS